MFSELPAKRYPVKKWAGFSLHVLIRSVGPFVRFS